MKTHTVLYYFPVPFETGFARVLTNQVGLKQKESYLLLLDLMNEFETFTVQINA